MFFYIAIAEGELGTHVSIRVPVFVSSEGSRCDGYERISTVDASHGVPSNQSFSDNAWIDAV